MAERNWEPRVFELGPGDQDWVDERAGDARRLIALHAGVAEPRMNGGELEDTVSAWLKLPEAEQGDFDDFCQAIAVGYGSFIRSKTKCRWVWVQPEPGGGEHIGLESAAGEASVALVPGIARALDHGHQVQGMADLLQDFQLIDANREWRPGASPFLYRSDFIDRGVEFGFNVIDAAAFEIFGTGRFTFLTIDEVSIDHDVSRPVELGDLLRVEATPPWRVFAGDAVLGILEPDCREAATRLAAPDIELVMMATLGVWARVDGKGETVSINGLGGSADAIAELSPFLDEWREFIRENQRERKAADTSGTVADG